MSDPIPVRLVGPAETASAVPYLLGFHPHDCLVMIAVDQHRVRLAVRLDLPADADEPSFLTQLRDAAGRLHAHGLDGCLLIGYGPSLAVAAAVTAGADTLQRAETTVLAAMRVHDGQVWTLGADGHDRPAQGVAFDATTSVAAAAATLAGIAPLPDRDAVAAQLTPISGEQRAAFAAATDRARRVIATALRLPGDSVDRDVSAAALRHIGHQVLAEAMSSYRDGQVPDDRIAALLSVLLTDAGVRELAIRHLRPEPWHVRMWIDLVRRVQPDLAIVPATLLALAALLNGNGALAGHAVARALDADPDDRLAQLLAICVEAGISPDALLQVITG
jgi:hypothetical protein